MSWVHHHHKTAPSSPSLFLNSSQTSLNNNDPLNSNSQQQIYNRYQAPSLSQTIYTSTPVSGSQQSPPLMTSQYSNKTNNISLKSTTTMRLNQSSYQPLPQQPPPQQQHPLQTLPPQQRHQSQHAQQPTSQPSTSTLNSITTQLQGAFNNQQQNSWTTQPQNYLPTSKMMQPTAQPPAAQTASSNKNWPQQQPPQQNFQNVTMYQQNTTPQQQQQQQQQQLWSQNPLQQQQQHPSTTYDNNYYQQQANNNNTYPQSGPHVAQQNPSTYYQQQPQVGQPPLANTNAVNFFDNSNSNNNNKNNQIAGGDGWGDWDWNDSSATAAPPAAVEQRVGHEPPPSQHTGIENSQHYVNQSTSIIADSFSGNQNNNETWSWGASEIEHVAAANKDQQKLENVAKPQNNSWNNWSTAGNEQQQPPPPSVQADLGHEQHNESWNWQATNNHQQQLATKNVAESRQNINSPPKSLAILSATDQHSQIASPPPPPPPVEYSTATLENHNYNTNAVPPPSNIPKPIFVTQAKPVTLPSRQFASPPSGNTPTTENPPETALTPPQGFQNVEESTVRPSAVVTPSLPPPLVATPPLSALAPPAGMPPAASSAANPFKRSGVAQHHRATGLMTTSTTATPNVPSTPAVFNMPPPPPADFANPSSIALMEPENNELPSQENQEVLSPPTTNISLPNALSMTMPAVVASFSLANAAPAQPPPNDERNQYLQTSHLSENAEEQQPEADGLLPPPGLSRLVLGEPELEASQQRMVMGTDAPSLDIAANQAAAMHLEERHADGEDTASENAVPVISNSGQGGPVSSSALSSDRNLYLVPGESNSATNQQQQRVVTGVELAEQREIEMDGENLEDEQIQQQQQLQQQQTLSPEGRNEPPVEGADEIVDQQQLPQVTSNSNHSTDQHLEQHHHHHHTNQSIKIKDLHHTSSPNDDDDSDERLLNDRVMNQSTAGSSKSRSKYENERMAATSRRREKRSSVQRYESDEYLNSDGEYSSDREERERRERDRRRNYREGSVRSERGGVVDEDEKRSRRHRNSDKRDKFHYEGEDRTRGNRGDRERGNERSKAEKRSQRPRGYDADSRYETEESARFDNRKDLARRSMRHPEAERNRRSDRSDQGVDYDDYNRRGYRSSKRSSENYESDRRDRRRSDKLRDPRYDPREYEEYRKHSSRNARESDLEKEVSATGPRSGRMHHDPRHAAANAMYGYPSSGYYDPYTAYYYQQMARTNPQAYAEWYKKYYGQAAATTAGAAQGAVMQGAPNAAHADPTLANASNDGRESVHSGRSSAHIDIKDRSGGISLRDPDPLANETQRLTPCKFITEHTVVSFGSGILVTVKPKYTPHGSISNIVKLLKFKPNDETRKLFKVFPGPLVRGLTHKKTVIEFCHEQIRLGPIETTIYAKQLITNNADKYRGSYTLMWNLLILLLKQNGMVVGTDIAELLLKNQQQFPYETPNSSLNTSLKSKSRSASPAEDMTTSDNPKDQDVAAETSAKLDNSNETADAEKLEEEYNDENSLMKSTSVSTSLTEDEITEKFRNYLLYGNVNEALEWATDNNLWGHALFLASKLDRRSHANVMMKFANKLSLNDPLQTLYQLMSGRTPSSVTCIQDEKWGDWRPHLSMILSNTSQKPELDRKAITALGDSLFNRGDLYAAHFCYLMAQVSFGRYQETATHETTLQQHLPKLVLLGSSHYKQFQDFAHNEAIIMTEIYEYARSLNDDKFSIVEFQPYKFLFASRLLDYGFHLKSLMYLEQIAVHITRDCSKYESSLINKVFEMADRLKYYDPVVEKTIDEQQQQPDAEEITGLNSTSQQMEEQKWLQNLRELAQQYQHDFISNTTGNVQGTQQQQQQQQQQQLSQTEQQIYDPNYNYQQQQIDQQFMEITKQFSELNSQYQQQQATTVDQQQPQTLTETVEQIQSAQSLDPYHYNQPQYLQPELPLANAHDKQQQQQQQHELVQPISEGIQDPYQQQQAYLQADVQQHHPQAAIQNYYDPAQQQQYNAIDGNDLDTQHQPNSYNYWAQQQQQQPHMTPLSEENTRPTISMPNSKTFDTDDEGNANKQYLGNEAKKQQQQQKGAKKDDKLLNKGLPQSNQNSGWFGGIWNKFTMKPKNQMILPDDKNPAIVWDAEKKKWVNTDGDETEQESFKPPPKMSDIMPQASQAMSAQQQQTVGQMPPQQQQQIIQPPQTNQVHFMDPQQMPHQQQQQYVPGTLTNSAPSPNPMQQQQNVVNNQPAAGAAKTPNLQSNMFKMQRNRTLKNAYVDVFNPSGAPVNKAAENILAPALPPAAVPQGGYFVPGSQISQPGGPQDQQYQQPQQQQAQQQETPNYYNPNQFTTGTGY